MQPVSEWGVWVWTYRDATKTVMAVVCLNHEGMEGRTRVGANNGAVLRMGGQDNTRGELNNTGEVFLFSRLRTED